MCNSILFDQLDLLLLIMTRMVITLIIRHKYKSHIVANKHCKTNAVQSNNTFHLNCFVQTRSAKIRQGYEYANSPPSISPFYFSISSSSSSSSSSFSSSYSSSSAWDGKEVRETLASSFPLHSSRASDGCNRKNIITLTPEFQAWKDSQFGLSQWEAATSKPVQSRKRGKRQH